MHHVDLQLVELFGGRHRVGQKHKWWPLDNETGPSERVTTRLPLVLMRTDQT